jgi:hypothetical protein
MTGRVKWELGSLFENLNLDGIGSGGPRSGASAIGMVIAGKAFLGY